MRFNNRFCNLMGIPDLPMGAFEHIGDRKIKPQGGGGNPISAITDPISSALGTDGGGGGILGAVSDVGESIDKGITQPIGAGLADVDKFVGNEIPGGWGTVGAAAALGTGLYFAPELAALAGGEAAGGAGAAITDASLGYSGAAAELGLEGATSGLSTVGASGDVLSAALTETATTSGLGTGFGDATTQSSMLAAQEAGMNLPQTQQAAMLAAQDAEFGTQLSNAYPSSQAGGTPQFTTPTYSTATGYQAPTAGLDTTAAPVGTAPSYPSSQAGGTPAATTPTGAPAPTTGTTTAPKTFMETLSQTGTEIKRKFTDPKSLADLTLRAAGMMAGSAIAGDGLSDQERALLDAQTAELQTLQSQNQALFNEKLNAARDLIGESKYFDPEYFGLQSARRAQTQVATAKRAGLSGLTGERRQAEERRYDIAGGRATGTAYDTGFQTGVQGRLATEQAGLSAFPSQYPNSAMSGYGSLMSTYGAADRRREQAARQVGSLFGGITGVPQSRSLG